MGVVPTSSQILVRSVMTASFAQVQKPWHSSYEGSLRVDGMHADEVLSPPCQSYAMGTCARMLWIVSPLGHCKRLLLHADMSLRLVGASVTWPMCI